MLFIYFLAGIKATQLQKRALTEISYDSLMLIEEILENQLQIKKILESSKKIPVTIAHVIVLMAVYGSKLKEVASIISQIDMNQTSFQSL